MTARRIVGTVVVLQELEEGSDRNIFDENSRCVNHSTIHCRHDADLTHARCAKTVDAFTQKLRTGPPSI
jgi:hypothetical protein